MREIDRVFRENDIKIFKGEYICYIGFFAQRSILEGKYNTMDYLEGDIYSA